jgi:hypothetical protein
VSYTLTAFTVDLDGLRRVVGAGSAALLAAVVEYHPEAFAEEEDPEEEELPLRAALSELLQGKLSDPASAHQYGYALRELCDYLGEEVGSWSDIRWWVIKRTGLDRVLESSGSPIPLPDNPGDFPVIGHIPRGQLPQRLEEARSRLATADEDFTPLYLQLKGWLEDAAAAGRDLILFYS